MSDNCTPDIRLLEFSVPVLPIFTGFIVNAAKISGISGFGPANFDVLVSILRFLFLVGILIPVKVHKIFCGP